MSSPIPECSVQFSFQTHIFNNFSDAENNADGIFAIISSLVGNAASDDLIDNLSKELVEIAQKTDGAAKVILGYCSECQDIEFSLRNKDNIEILSGSRNLTKTGISDFFSFLKNVPL